MHIGLLTPDDITSATLLHYKTMPDLSSRIGPSFVKSYYSLILRHPEVFYCFGMREKNRLYGLILGTSDYSGSKKLLKKLYTIKNMMKLFYSVISGKVAITRVIARIRFENAINTHITENYGYINSLVVKAEVQRRGIGKILLSNIIKKFRQTSRKYAFVDTRAEFTNASAFYKSQGFEEIYSSDGSVLLKRNISVA